MKRPEKSAAEIGFMPLMRVLLEPVRSAEPPMSSGTAGTSASSAISEALRVAIFLRRGRELLLDGLHRRGEGALGKLAAHSALEFAAQLRGERPHALGPAIPRGSRPRRL